MDEGLVSILFFTARLFAILYLKTQGGRSATSMQWIVILSLHSEHAVVHWHHVDKVSQRFFLPVSLSLNYAERMSGIVAGESRLH